MNAARAALRPVARQVRQYHAKTNFVQPHMNELPVPSGSWQAAYERRQKKYNAALAGGILFFSGTFFIAYSNGFLNVYGPPDTID